MSEVKRKYNRYDLESQEYGIGWTSNTNEEFWFDKEDYDKIKNYCWNYHKNKHGGYIEANDLENGIVDFDKKYILKLKNVVNTDGKLPKLYVQLDEENENWKF